jgi:GNAT superfamily N-acetyltransferase
MGQPMSLRIAPASAEEKDKWLPLWGGYLEFYRTNLADEITDLTWARCLDPAEPMHMLAARDGGEWRGFAIFVLHRSTWARDNYCYLEDLFTAPEARGKGIGAQLIEAGADLARTYGCSRYYWLTEDSNRTAQALYDKIARKSGFIQYVKPL